MEKLLSVFSYVLTFRILYGIIIKNKKGGYAICLNIEPSKIRGA